MPACLHELTYRVGGVLTLVPDSGTFKRHMLVLSLLVVSSPSWAVVSSNSGSTRTNGYSINEFVGADRFYQAGYTGTRSVVASIEGGHIWNYADALTHVQTFLDARAVYSGFGFDYESLAEYDRHATWVGAAIAGRGGQEYQKGVAYGAQLWSGSIATKWVGVTQPNSINWSTGHAFTEPYAQALLWGVNGRRADVVNSSWGGGTADASGSNVFSLSMDAIALVSKRTVVFSAMNNGPAGNTIGFPQSGYNTISVGALGDDLAGYQHIAPFSSRSPSDYRGPDGAVPVVRARVDIVAPGQNLTVGAYYGGVSGGNQGGSDITGGGTNWYSWNLEGTSFSAPIVASGAALLNDVAYDRFASNEYAHDGQVIKAVLLNSASKVEGWDNGQAVDGAGVVRTTQALDFTYGAGAMDLRRAFDQFTAGTTDLPDGLSEMAVAQVGWDHGIIEEGQDLDYTFSDVLGMGHQVTATLNWFVGRSWQGNETGGAILATDDYFTNLSLQLLWLDSPAGESLVAESDAAYINTEHFSISIAQSGRYKLRVHWVGERYDLIGNEQQTFGLAWMATATPVPEPSVVWLICAGLVVLVLRADHRRRACLVSSWPITRCDTRVSGEGILRFFIGWCWPVFCAKLYTLCLEVKRQRPFQLSSPERKLTWI